jgi:hypothetical protein
MTCRKRVKTMRLFAWTLIVTVVAVIPPATARDWSVQAKTGEKSVAHEYCTTINLRACTEGPLPTISITAGPAHGSTEFGQSTDVVRFIRQGEKRVSAGKCTGMADHCITIFYTSTSGYEGSDRISYTVGHANGETWHDNVSIEVK